MTSLYPATSATSRAGIASATQGSRPACQSRITAASIISRSASGSATLPKADSTRHRRASQPSSWSVTPATPKVMAAGQLRPPPAGTRRAMKTGISASRKTVSAFGICASGTGTARTDIGSRIEPSRPWLLRICSTFVTHASDFPRYDRIREEVRGTAPRRVRRADSVAHVAKRLTIPGFVNAHSHAFQRAFRGRTEGGDFWAWRDAMLSEAEAQTPERVRADYERVYSEMRRAGYTAVGEFHYLGFEEARAAAEAAASAEFAFVLLYAAYARGGLERFRQASASDYLHQVEDLRAQGLAVGLAPHSVRACPADWLEEIGRYAEEHELPLHVHADEQPREIEECVAEHGIRPIELLARSGCLLPRTTVVHATHADGAELD